jgi:tripartite-type tricarboxylate transporter receptor subunit TctC
VEHAEVSFYSLSILAFQLANQMNVNRRKLLQLAGAAAAAPVFPRPASALDYPTRPVRLIVGYVAGGPNDIVARIVGQSLSERLGQPFVIVNHPGAASNLAAQEVVRSTADGYTLLFVNASNAINATLYEKLNFNFINDIEPVAGIIRVPNVVEVNLNVPAHSIPEFIDYAKANPGKVNMGSGGIGTTVHMAGELFKMMTGINMVHVPYRGAAPALVDLMAGRLQVMFDAMPNSIGYIKAGRLRALAVTTLTRSKTLPDLPTVASFVPGYEASSWYGIGAPKGTPTEIITKLNTEVNAVLADPMMKERLADLGGTELAGSPADFGRLIVEETEKWGKAVRFSGAKAS